MTKNPLIASGPYPAVKRAGRLIAARQFNRLDWPRAQRLAQARGLQLEFPLPFAPCSSLHAPSFIKI